MMLNKGISFGFFPGVPPILFGIVLLFLINYALKMRELWERVGIWLIVVGGGGNLVNRFMNGGVVDNLNFFGIFHNNVWDYLIAVGLVVYLIQYWYGNTHNF